MKNTLIENNQCVLVRRDNREKVFISLDNLEEGLTTTMNAYAEAIYNKALENVKNRSYACTSIDEINEKLAANGDGFVKAMWCGEEDCEDKVKELTGVGSRCIPFEQENLSESCVCCGKPAKHMVYWGKAY